MRIPSFARLCRLTDQRFSCAARIRAATLNLENLRRCGGARCKRLLGGLVRQTELCHLNDPVASRSFPLWLGSRRTPDLSQVESLYCGAALDSCRSRLGLRVRSASVIVRPPHPRSSPRAPYRHSCSHSLKGSRTSLSLILDKASPKRSQMARPMHSRAQSCWLLV